MDYYSTPIRKKKARILGMTIPQLGLLVGLLAVQLVILMLTRKFIVFAPKEEQQVEIPTLVVLATAIEPTITSTTASTAFTIPPTTAPPREYCRAFGRRWKYRRRHTHLAWTALSVDLYSHGNENHIRILNQQTLFAGIILHLDNTQGRHG